MGTGIHGEMMRSELGEREVGLAAHVQGRADDRGAKRGWKGGPAQCLLLEVGVWGSEAPSWGTGLARGLMRSSVCYKCWSGIPGMFEWSFQQDHKLSMVGWAVHLGWGGWRDGREGTGPHKRQVSGGFQRGGAGTFTSTSGRDQRAER